MVSQIERSVSVKECSLDIEGAFNNLAPTLTSALTCLSVHPRVTYFLSQMLRCRLVEYEIGGVLALRYEFWQ